MSPFLSYNNIRFTWHLFAFWELNGEDIVALDRFALLGGGLPLRQCLQHLHHAFAELMIGRLEHRAETERAIGQDRVACDKSCHAIVLGPLHALTDIVGERFSARKFRLAVVAEGDDYNAIICPLAILRDGRFVGLELVNMFDIRLGNMANTLHLYAIDNIERPLCPSRHRMQNAECKMQN